MDHRAIKIRNFSGCAVPALRGDKRPEYGLTYGRERDRNEKAPEIRGLSL